MRKGLFLLVLVAIIIYSCTQLESDPEIVQPVTYAQLSSVNDNYVPDSLQASQGVASIRNDLTVKAIPAQLQQFIANQPTYLKSFLATSKVFLEEAVDLTGEIDNAAGVLTEGSTGQLPLEEDTVYWNYTTSRNYEFLIEDLYYLAVSGNVITLKVDENGKYEAVIEFVSETSWTNTITITDIPASDVNIPGKMKIIIRREDSVWKGKVMSYHPYAPAPAENSPTKSVYTEFVADTAKANANLYFLNYNVSDINSIAEYAFANIVENYPEYTGSSDSLVSVYPNPVRITSSSSTWGSTDSVSFPDDISWIVPNDFYQIDSVQLPSEL